MENRPSDWPVFFRLQFTFGSSYAALAAGQTGHANFMFPPCNQEKTKPRLRLHWTYR